MEIEFVKLSSQRMVSGWRSNLRNFHLRSQSEIKCRICLLCQAPIADH
jgi:hypothetical protein